MTGTLRCRLFGHDFGIAFAESEWWLCSRCGADQLAYAREQEVTPAWDWLEVTDPTGTADNCPEGRVQVLDTETGEVLDDD